MNLWAGVGNTKWQGNCFSSSGCVGITENLLGVLVAGLNLHFGVVKTERPSIRGGVPVFIRPRLEAQLYQLLGDAFGRPFTGTATTELLLTNMDQAIKESTVCEYD